MVSYGLPCIVCRRPSPRLATFREYCDDCKHLEPLVEVACDVHPWRGAHQAYHGCNYCSDCLDYAERSLG